MQSSGACWQIRRSLRAAPLDKEEPRKSLGNCPKSLGCASNEALRATETVSPLPIMASVYRPNPRQERP
jgi:hypothetical protein